MNLRPLQISYRFECFSLCPQSYHLERLHELKMHLVNESWTVCPVRDSFSVFQLQEYFGIKSSSFHQQGGSPPSSPAKTSQTWTHLCPFDLESLDMRPNQEDLFGDRGAKANGGGDQDVDESSSEDELKRDFVEDGDFVARLATEHLGSRSKLGRGH